MGVQGGELRQRRRFGRDRESNSLRRRYAEAFELTDWVRLESGNKRARRRRRRGEVEEGRGKRTISSPVKASLGAERA